MERRHHPDSRLSDSASSALRYIYVPPPGSERTAPKRQKAPTDPPAAKQSRAALAQQRQRTAGQHVSREAYDSQPAQGRLIIPSPTVTTDDDAVPGSNCGTVTMEDRQRVEQALEREYDDDGRWTQSGLPSLTGW